MINKFVFFTLLSLLAGCASTPNFDTTQVDRSLTPQSVVAETDLSLGKTALWGGTILSTRNLQDATVIEVLAYPLDTSHRPLLQRKPLGRFILQYPEYLEPTTFTQGRLVSVLGKVSENQRGNVGESTYTYAVIRSSQIHLWSLNSRRSRTSFHLGVGIRL